ncbi:hypothetical protein [Mycolicibacterium xanthum]|uniref:hypothetical protein n=1 Tax=Mycolicibacterium xanthum TaxID=2796469 RepID=UPI00355889BC
MSAPASDPPTAILRRHPTGEPPTSQTPRAKPVAIGPARTAAADARPAVLTAVMSILSGWASAVIATNLIASWWATDPLFCVAIGFLAAITAGALISGLIALLLRRRPARLLIVVGSVIALLIFLSLFVAGAALPVLVYALPALPVASIAAAMLPGTARWSRSG